MKLRTRVLAAVCTALVIAACSTNTAGATSLTQVTGFGSNPGNLQMFEYVPAGLSNRPLVVACHANPLASPSASSQQARVLPTSPDPQARGQVTIRCA